MRGNAQVIAQLNLALKEELTAINQYFLHAEMCHNWGYHALGTYIKKQSIDEMKHAEELIERLLFLDAVPKMEYLALSVGASVREQLRPEALTSTCCRLPQSSFGKHVFCVKKFSQIANALAERLRFREWTNGRDFGIRQ